MCAVCLFAALPRDPSFVSSTGGGLRVDAVTDATDSTCHNHDTNPQVSDPLSEFSTRYFKNLKLGHLNINSLGGSKWTEIYELLNANLLDIFVIGESKLDDSFASSQFQIPGYRLFRKDRCTKKFGGGVVVFVKSGLKFPKP